MPKFSATSCNPDGILSFEGDEFFQCKPPDPQPCVVCKKATNWWSTIFMVPLCSEECARKNDKDYRAAGGSSEDMIGG